MSDKPEIRRMEFVFARIHFESGGLFSADASNRIKKFLSKAVDIFIDKGRFKWAFGDVGTQNIDGEEITFGRLGRTVTEKFGTIYKDHSYRKELMKSNEASYSNFFILPQRNILALEDRYNLGRNKFVKMLKTFWQKYDGAEIDCEFIKDEVEIFEIIKTWDRLTEASFDLVPSNPSSKEDYKPIDEVIRKAAAKRAKLKFENKDGTLSKEKSVIQQGMSMANDGYGEFKLKGLKGNVVQSFNSISRITRKEFSSIDDLGAVLGQIYNEMKKIWGNKHNE